MSRLPLLPVVALVLATACSSTSGSPAAAPDAGSDDGGAQAEAAVATFTEHGSILDYGTLISSGNVVPVAGLTVTEGDQSTTTDAEGNWSFTVPVGTTLAPSIAGTTKGDPYSTLFLPQAVSGGTDVDRGIIPVADQSTFQLERLVLSNDSTKAIVHVAAYATGSCSGTPSCRSRGRWCPAES
jgi:hypothetical protein